MNLALRFGLSLVVAALIIYLLLLWSGAEPATIAARLTSLSARDFWVSSGVLLLIYGLRGARFRVLLSNNPDCQIPGFGMITSVTAAHGLAAYFVPAKLGEAALVMYLRRYLRVPGAEGLALLVVSRLHDLAAVAGSLSVACILLGSLGAYPELDWLLPLGFLLAVLTAAFIWASSNGDRLFALVTGVMRILRLDRTAIGAKVMGIATKLQAALQRVKRGTLWKSAALSIPIWLGVYLYYGVLARGYGLQDISFSETIFGASLAVLANLLPINGFAGFGTQDAGWVVGFTSLGADREIATESALAFHAVYIFHICLFGLIGHLSLVARGPAAKGENEDSATQDQQAG
ncbi:MAG: hypothetical protein ACI841_001618 [Planctomycetota bacterium]